MRGKKAIYLALLWGLPLAASHGAEPPKSEVIALQESYRQALSKVESDVKAVLEKQNNLENKLSLLALTGSGQGVWGKFQTSGPGSLSAQDFAGLPLWTERNENPLGNKQGVWANQNLHLALKATPAPGVEAVSQLFFRNIWGEPLNSLKIEQVYLRAGTSLGELTMGNFQTSLSPLILGYEPPAVPVGEAEIFRQAREARLQEAQITPGLRNLQGIQVKGQVGTFAYLALGTRLVDKGLDGLNVYRYLYGGQVGVTDERKAFFINYVRLADDSTSGTQPPTYPVMAGTANSFSGKLNLGKHLSLAGERAQSRFDDDILTGLAAQEGQAFSLQAAARLEPLNLQVKYLYVEPTYYAPTAQSRDVTLGALSPFGDERARTVGGVPVYLDGALNPVVNEEILPFGPATPNRAGLSWQGEIGLGACQVALVSEGLREIEPEAGKTERREFWRQGLGLTLNLQQGLGKAARLAQPLTLTYGWLKEATQRPGESNNDPGLDLQTVTLDTGLTYQINPGLAFLLGAKQITHGVGGAETLVRRYLQASLRYQPPATRYRVQVTYQRAQGKNGRDWSGADQSYVGEGLICEGIYTF